MREVSIKRVYLVDILNKHFSEFYTFFIPIKYIKSALYKVIWWNLLNEAEMRIVNNAKPNQIMAQTNELI
jgi:hypothetical protein